LKAYRLLLVGFFLGLLFDYKDGRNKFLENVSQACFLIITGLLIFNLPFHPEYGGGTFFRKVFQAYHLLMDDFLLCLLFDPEDKGDSFIRNLLQAHRLIIPGFCPTLIFHPAV
jgi:hypothetical protein